MSAMLPRDVARRVRLFQVRTRKLMESGLGGEFRSVFRGRGVEFDEVRPYEPGDDVRLIDWNVTARTGDPHIKKHIEDRDLWRFALNGTREIQANVFSYPYDFDVWDTLMEQPVENLIAEGRAIERKHFKDIGELLGVVTRRMVIGGHNVPVANLPYIHVSDAAHQLAKGEPFAACYWDTPKGRVFGLRSSDAGLDVSEVAKQYGGGGHRNSAGFTVNYDTARTFEV